MPIEDEIVRSMSRRKFLAGLGLSAGSVLLARQALLQTRAEDLVRQPEGVQAAGGGPGATNPFSGRHEDLSDVSADQHHLRLHALSDALDHSGAITDSQHGVRTLANAHGHGDLSGVTADQHHARLHALDDALDHSGTLPFSSTRGGLSSSAVNYEADAAVLRALRLVAGKMPGTPSAARSHIVEPDSGSFSANYDEFRIDPNSIAFGANSLFYRTGNFIGVVKLNQKTGLTIIGLDFAPVISGADGGSPTITALKGARFAPESLLLPANTPITDWIGVEAKTGTVSVGTPATTLERAIVADPLGSGATTVIGVDVNPNSRTSGTTRIGIRQQGPAAETNRLTGRTRIGDQTAPTETLEDAGNFKHEGFIDSLEIATPATPAANRGRLYFKDSGGVSKLFYVGDDGVEVGPLAAAGGGGEANTIAFPVYLSKTKTNIGTAYVDIYNTLEPDELFNVIVFDNFADFRILFIWDYVGAGTQQCRFVDRANNANVLYESPTFTADQDPNDSGWTVLPAWATGEKQIEAQGKSTTATDDPIFKGWILLLR